VPYEAVKGKDNYNPDNIRKNLMFGTPDEAIEKLLVYEAAGVDQYCLGLTFNLPFELQKRTLELFAKEILPFFAAREKEQQRKVAAG
jgi:alkanesulfonate monooxygenase SsuD/methylene tetrahydromethanopterin reductase-like flavin-dependent oxidoreductase (luciferase family)